MRADAPHGNSQLVFYETIWSKAQLGHVNPLGKRNVNFGHMGKVLCRHCHCLLAWEPNGKPKFIAHGSGPEWRPGNRTGIHCLVVATGKDMGFQSDPATTAQGRGPQEHLGHRWGIKRNSQVAANDFVHVGKEHVLFVVVPLANENRGMHASTHAHAMRNQHTRARAKPINLQTRTHTHTQMTCKHASAVQNAFLIRTSHAKCTGAGRYTAKQQHTK